MIIDQDKCTGCGLCGPYCPVSAIRRHARDKEKGVKAHSVIDRDECVECGACFRSRVCKPGAIIEDALPYPRVLRRAFSDPSYVHQGTDIPGRGTEEMKTNDVTGRFWDGFIGIGLEFGRPGVGTRLGETEKGFKKLLPLGVKLEPLNPLTQLLENPATGDLKPEVRGEKVLSAIVEGLLPLEKTGEAVAAIAALAAEVDTVVTVDFIGKAAPDGSLPMVAALEKAGARRSLNAKVNVGLGRPLFRS